VPQFLRLEPGLEPFPGYFLRLPLGRGGFGTVWEAVTPEGKGVALKFLPSKARQATALEIRSLQAIRGLRHPHLIRIERVWCYQGHVVIAMELADGSLADLYDSYQARTGKPIVPEHACLLLADAAEALDFLNARQHWIDDRLVAIQHCDIKPGNLLLVGETLKVADFGLSTLLGSRQEARNKVGTLEYLAPEVFQGKVASQTDQYALAVTYCILRGGRFPFRDTPTGFKSGYVRPPPDLTMLRPEERPLIARALIPTPQDRWPSCRELFSRLIDVLSKVLDPTSKRNGDRDARPRLEETPAKHIRLSTMP
jgi:serine/threonine protein kinase